MAINIAAELERLYTKTRERESSLTERLNQMDSYAGQVNPAVRSEMLDFSDRPEGYNPLQDIGSAIDFSERSRDARGAASMDLERTQAASLSLMAQLDALAQRQNARADKETPEEEFMRTLRLEAAKEQIKQGKLTFNPDTGELVMGKGSKASETSDSIVNLVDQLLGKNTKPITGFMKIEPKIPGMKAKQTQALYDQLKGILALDNREKLKGSGAISDFESKTLERAASSLNQDLSDDDFRKTLENLKNDLVKGTGSVGSGGSEKKGAAGRFVIERVE